MRPREPPGLRRYPAHGHRHGKIWLYPLSEPASYHPLSPRKRRRLLFDPRGRHEFYHPPAGGVHHLFPAGYPSTRSLLAATSHGTKGRDEDSFAADGRFFRKFCRIGHYILDRNATLYNINLLQTP